MPTSGESGIHPSSTYNLRSKPLPKSTTTTRRPSTRSTSNKENIGTGRPGPSTRLTKKAEKSSKIPVSQNSRIPVPKSASSKTTSSTTPNRRKVPDFEKLHKNWNKKFQQGKAVTKKPCTTTEAFDLTRPGTQFKSAYYAGTGKDIKTRRQTGIGLRIDDDFEVDGGALNDILNGRGLEEEEKQTNVVSSRATLAGTGISTEFTSQVDYRRQTLGQLPSTGAGRVNNSSNVSSVREIDKGSRVDRGKKSLVQEQKDAGICFEASADALASILNNTGLHPSSVKEHDNILGGRQTIAGISAKQRQSGRFNTTGRNSIYYQKPKNHDVNKVYSEFAKRTLSRFTMDGNQATFKNAFIESLLPDNRGSLYIKPGLHTSEKAAPMPHSFATSSSSSVAKSLTPSRVPVTDKTQSAAGLRRTPGTAARVPNPNFNKALSRQEQSCSPALTPSRRIPITPGDQSQKNVRWADVLSSPRDQDRAEEMSTKDVVAVLNFGDDGDEAISPETKTRLNEVEKLEAETVVNRQKLNEMEEIERQLELEIARLHQEEEIEDQAPAEHPHTTLPTNEYAVEHNLLDHVPTKQPADYVDPIKLTKDRVETIHGSVPSPAPARNDLGIPTLEHHDSAFRQQQGDLAQAALHVSAAAVARPGFSMPDIAHQGHAQRKMHHPQEGFQMRHGDMEAADFEREFSLQKEEGKQQDVFQTGQSYTQAADLGRNFNKQGDIPGKITMNSSNSASTLSVNMKHPSSSNGRYISQHPTNIPDSSIVSAVSNTITGSHNGMLQTSDNSNMLHLSLGPQGMLGERSSDLMVSDSTESFRGIYPAFLQNSSQTSQRSQGQVVANAGHNSSSGFANMQTSSAITPGVYNNVSSQSSAVHHAHPSHQHHMGREMMNTNAMPFVPTQTNVPAMAPTNLYSQRTDIQSSVPHGASAGAKQNIDYMTRPTLENSRPSIHTPQPVRRARAGSSFLKPALDSQSMSTPLHHSSILPTPIQTPLSMRNPALMSTIRREHQQWPSPVVAKSFQANVQTPGDVFTHSTSNTAMVQPQSYSHPIKPAFSNSSQAPRLISSDAHRLSTSHVARYAHPSKPTYLLQQSSMVAESSLSSATQEGHSNRPSNPANLAPAAFQCRRPHASSLSDVDRVVPSQGQSSGVTRSLSLSENLMGSRRHEQVQKVGGRMETEREASSQLFHQVLLDEECALYACRLKGRHTPQSAEQRPLNPIAKILLYGDDMHFVPVRNINYVVSPPPGSAFSSYHQTDT